ncbi:MAG: type III-B CRISPR module RAMP protein Cmr1 [Gammaproteobacteria bacterium]|nr:type III-B CRISPR module RAMP protein Cmr1 [Gammaproteobacteria bacterium]
MAERLSADFEVLTPLFMGEADQSESALRPPSIKGLLRFWYRAVAPTAACSEAELFGGAGKHQGQAPFLLRVRIDKDRAGQPASWHWNNRQIARFDKGHGRETRNGLRYLGYPFGLGAQREALAPATRFILEALFPKPATAAQRRALLAAVWLLGHLGGAGSRARRGFGSLALQRWQLDSGAPWPELEALQPLAAAPNSGAWRHGYEQVRALFEDWFGRFDQSDHPPGDQPPPRPHLGGKTRLHLAPRAGDDWQAALAWMGRRLQDFRLRKAPDYQQVKNHLSGARRLERAPERAAFGLPLTFRYGSLRAARPITFEPFDPRQGTTLQRQGSLLHLRLARLADGLHPLFLRLDGAVPGQAGSLVAPHAERRPLRAAEVNLLDRFMDQLEEAR